MPALAHAAAAPRRAANRAPPALDPQVKRALTMTEKILANHSGNTTVMPGDNIWTRVDKLMTHDVCGPGTFGIFQKEFGEAAQVRARAHGRMGGWRAHGRVTRAWLYARAHGARRARRGARWRRAIRGAGRWKRGAVGGGRLAWGWGPLGGVLGAPGRRRLAPRPVASKRAQQFGSACGGCRQRRAAGGTSAERCLSAERRSLCR